MLKQIIVFSIIFFLSTAHVDAASFELNQQERKWMQKFFHDLLFVEGGIYTLWGSKPMTEIVLVHYTEEEVEAILKGAPEEETRNCYVNDCYDLPENWEKWEGIKNRFPIKKYLLFRSHFDADEKISFVYFVDILKTATVIQSNYALFQKAVGFDFHPFEAVLSMPDNTSVFWQKVRESKESPLLWGVLFGYGEINASAFHWKYFDCPQSCKKNIEAYSFQFSNPPPKGQTRLSSDNFILPSFASFTNEDQVIKRYEKERKKIKKTYKGKDLLQLTLQKLTS